MVAPIIVGAGQLLLGTALTGGAAWAGSALMPTLEKAMGNDVKWKLNDDPADWGANHERRVIQTDRQGNATYRPLDNKTVEAFGGWQVLAARNKEQSARLQRMSQMKQLEANAERGQARADFLTKLKASEVALAREAQEAQTALGIRRLDVEEADSIRRDATNRQQLEDSMEDRRTLAGQAEARRLDDQVVNTNQARQTAYQNERAAAGDEHDAAMKAWVWSQENASRPGQLLMLAGSRLMRGAS